MLLPPLDRADPCATIVVPMPGFLENISNFMQQLRPRWVGLALGIYWGSLFVATHMPLPEDILAVRGSDKVAHFGAYAGLGFLLGWWLLLRVRSAGRRVLFTAFLILLGWAVVDELLQIPVNRSADILDCLADWAGAACGLLVLWVWQGRVAEESRSGV